MAKKSIDEILAEKEVTEKAISDTISGMAFFFQKEDERKSADDTRKVVDFYVNECNRDDDYYATQMHLICHRFNEVPAKPWLMSSYRQHVQKWDKFIVESIFNGLFSHWVYKMIEHHEDNSGGQADKERFITRRLLEAIDTQTNVSLYSEYKDEPGKQAYWSPKYFKDTHQVKIEFVSWWMGEDMSKYVN
jgi:hypothetical protein